MTSDQAERLLATSRYTGEVLLETHAKLDHEHGVVRCKCAVARACCDIAGTLKEIDTPEHKKLRTCDGRRWASWDALMRHVDLTKEERCPGCMMSLRDCADECRVADLEENYLDQMGELYRD